MKLWERDCGNRSRLQKVRGARPPVPGIAVGIVVTAGRVAVVDAVPGVAGGVLGLVPLQLRLALDVLPAALQVVFGLVPGAVGVTAARRPAIAVGGGQVVVAAALGVGAVGVGGAPVGVLLGGVDRLGDPLAGKAAGQAAHGGADQRSRRACHGAADGRAGYRATRRADAGAYRMGAGLAGQRVAVGVVS